MFEHLSNIFHRQRDRLFSGEKKEIILAVKKLFFPQLMSRAQEEILLQLDFCCLIS